MALDPFGPSAGLDLSSPVAGLDPFAPDPATPGPFKRGLKSGVSDLKSIGGGILQYAGRGFGAKPLETLGEEIQQNAATESAPYRMQAEDVGKAFDKGVVPGLGAAADFVGYTVGNQIPMMATTILGGVGGRLAAGAMGATKAAAGVSAAERAAAVAKVASGTATAGEAAIASAVKAADIGAGLGLGASSVGMELGQIAGEGLKPENNASMAQMALGALAAGSLDTIMPIYLARKMGLIGAAERALTPRAPGILPIAKDVATTALKGGAFETVQETAQTAIERASANQALSGADASSDYLNSGVAGGILGILTGGIAGGVHGLSRPIAAKPGTISPEMGTAVPTLGTNVADLGTNVAGTETPVPASITPEEVHARLTAAHADATKQVADLEPTLVQAQQQHAALVAARAALDDESKLPIGERRADKALTAAKKAATEQVKAARGQVESIGGQLFAAKNILAELAPQLEAATAALPKPEPAPGTLPDLVVPAEGLNPAIAPRAEPIQSTVIADPNAPAPTEAQHIDRAVKGVHALFREQGMPLTTTEESLATPPLTPREVALATVEQRAPREAIPRASPDQMKAVEANAMSIIEPLAKTMAETKTETPEGQAKIAAKLTKAMRGVVQEAAKQDSVEAAQQYVMENIPYALKGHGVSTDAADMAKAVSAGVGLAKTQFSKGATKVDRSPKGLRAWAEEKAKTDPTYDIQVVTPADEGISADTYPDGRPFKVIDGGDNEYGTFAKRGEADKFITEELDGRSYMQPRAESNAALTQDEFETLPRDAQTAALNELNTIRRAQGVDLIGRLHGIIGDRPELKVVTFQAEQGGPIGSYTRTGPYKAVVSMALNAKDKLSVADHEGYHFAEDWFLSSSEKKVVANAIKEGKPLYDQLVTKLQQYDRENGTSLTDEVTGTPAEARAYAFELYRRGEFKAEGALARAWQKLQQFFERIGNAVKGMGFTSIEDVFAALAHGQMAERQMVAPEEREGGTYQSVANTEKTNQFFDVVNVELPEFKTWFGGSKVVDAQGAPLRVYHGTSVRMYKNYGDMVRTQDGLHEFRMGGGLYGVGAYFTGSQKRADGYTKSGQSGAIYPVYLSLRNPITPQEYMERFGRGLLTAKEGAQRRALLMSEGFDGVLDARDGDVWEAVAFSPEQVKSAVSNSGEFSPSARGILFSKAAVEMSVLKADGQLQPTQMGEQYAHLVQHAQPSNELMSRAFGVVKEDMLGGVGRWWTNNVSTPNYIASNSTGFRNAYDTFNTYSRYRKILAEQLVGEKLQGWHDASDADRKAAFDVMLERTVKGYSTTSSELANALSTLTPKQQTLFHQATAMVAGVLKQQFESQKETRKLQLTTPGAYEKWVADRQEKIDDMLDKGYVPLRRYGDHTVTVFMEAPDGTRVKAALEGYESPSQAQLAANAYAQEIARSGLDLKVEVGRRSKNEREIGVSLEQFLGTLRRQGIDISQAERERLVVAMTNSDSLIRTQMMHRTGLAGYSTDSMRVLYEFGVNTTSELAYAKFAPALDAALDGAAVKSDIDMTTNKPIIEIGESFGKREDGVPHNLWEQDGPMSGFYKDRANAMADVVLVPDRQSAWATKLRTAGVMYFIGGSLSGAAVNTLSIPMVLTPWLSQHTDYLNATTTSLKTWKDAWQHYGTLRDMEKMRNPDAATAARLDAAGIDKNMRAAIVAASDHIFDTEIHQMLGISQGSLYSKSRNIQRAAELWMAPFRIAEQTNRLTSFMAAYKIASSSDFTKPDGTKGALTGQELFRFAAGAVDATQNNYNTNNRPGIMTNPVGALMFQFKSFPLFIIEAAHLMYKQNPKSAVYMLLGLTAMSGVEGLPFAEELLNVIDVVSQRLFNSPFNSRRAMRNAVKSVSEFAVGIDASDAFMRGLANELTGVSIATRVSSGLLPGTRIGAADASEGRVLSDLAGAPYSMVKDTLSNIGGLARGVATGDWKQAADALRAGGPIAIRNAIKGAEQLSTGQASDSKGRLLTPVSTMDGLLQMTGLSSAAVAKMYDMESIIAQTTAFHTQVSKDIQTQLVKAYRDNDQERIKEINEFRQKWNEQNPTLRIDANPVATQRAVMLAGLPLPRREQLLLNRRIRGGFSDVLSNE